MIPEHKILEIRERASIVEVISDHLTLRKAGRNHLGICPFHAEKTPSFTVNEEKGIFHCFGCGVGGNVFHFLMRYEQLTFPEAVERVGRRYGIAVERQETPGARREAEERESLYRLNERAAAYFHQALLAQAEGKKALGYLKARGIDESMARRFYLGYAPPRGAGLVEFLKREGLSLKDAVRLGLISQRGATDYGERLLERLIFPIVNSAGRVVGFGGRVTAQGSPKYLNSPETPLFRKGSNLYGLFQAKEAVRAVDRVAVVEGYLDVIALAQFGISYAVATLGTALTPDHVRILGRFTKNIIALFDGDEAGEKAAARSFEIFIDAGQLGRAAFLPKGDDPDTFVRARGKEALEAVLDQAVPLADYAFSWLERQQGTSLEGKSQTAKEIQRLLSKVRNPFEADLLARRAVDSLGISEALLRRSARPSELPSAAPRTGKSPATLPPEAREDLAERSLLSLILRFPSMVQVLAAQEDIELLVGPPWREIIQRILAEWRERGEVDPGRLTQSFSVDQASQMAALMLDGENLPEQEREKVMADCVAHLRRRHLRSLERELRRAIRTAEEKKDEKAKRERMLEWQEVVRRERQLERQRLATKT
ncbi:MAG: DNA primase [Deltaproteobacteria bacterium GWA2_57_13]|nr:MAG: DNA primase [Deltaproteobacteria bacterium GWA2_57_13]